MTEVSRRPQGCTNFKLRQLLRGVARLYDAELGQVGPKGTQFSLLSALHGYGPIAPGELSRRLGMDPSTLTRNVRLLIDQGWVVQGPGSDPRSRSLTLTESGRAKQLEAKAHWKRAQLALNERLGVTEVATLHRLIDGALTRLGPAAHSSDEEGP